MESQLLEALRLGLHLQVNADASAPVRPVGGGCIHQAFVIESTPPIFVKVNSADHDEMFEAEMDGLKAIVSSSAIRTPSAILTGRVGKESFLALEYLQFHPGTQASWRLMGERLAQLHRGTSEDGRFGWHRDNYIGATPQRNCWRDDWIEFWREERLGFQFQLAAARGVRFEGSERLLERLEGLFRDHTVVPSLLHGDLWSGNASFTADGEPVIYDPACYYGDRECDMAFTEMFGGFPAAFYEAYDANWPRNDGWFVRRDLYNLYHVLNHFHLFGAGYQHQAERLIRSLNAVV